MTQNVSHVEKVCQIILYAKNCSSTMILCCDGGYGWSKFAQFNASAVNATL